MGADEEGTLAALKAIRRELGDPQIKEHRGRIVKTTGDGLLVEFPSVVDAVRCAVEVQRAMVERNAEMPADRRIEFRIGIHQDDIIVEDSDIFGDGVNIAARLEALAEPGSICVSVRVREDAAGRLGLAFEDIGEQSLRNIARPVRVYRIGPRAPRPHAAGTAAVRLALPDMPSLAVLPSGAGIFLRRHGRGDHDRDRAPALAVRHRPQFELHLQVARELGVRYVLEGSVRKAGNRVRITGQLIDTATGAHIWTDRFDGALDDIFELQDQVASSVVCAIEPRLRQSEIERATRKPTDSLDAYHLYLQALAQFRKWTAEGCHEAIALLRRALALDPSYAPAAGLFAWCRVLQRVNRMLSDEEITEGARLARQAIALGQEDPDALWMGGWGMINLAGEGAAGLNAIKRSLALNPNSAHAWNFCGWTRAACLNRSPPAIEALQRAMRLSPLDPQRWMFYGGMALAHLVAGRHQEAVEWADRALHEQPRATAVVAFRAAACGHLGRLEEARECVRRYRELAPGKTIADEKKFLGTIFSPEAFAVYTESLRKAGLPEG